jgi:hypothetical protein
MDHPGSGRPVGALLAAPPLLDRRQMSSSVLAESFNWPMARKAATTSWSAFQHGPILIDQLGLACRRLRHGHAEIMMANQSSTLLAGSLTCGTSHPLVDVPQVGRRPRQAGMCFWLSCPNASAMRRALLCTCRRPLPRPPPRPTPRLRRGTAPRQSVGPRWTNPPGKSSRWPLLQATRGPHRHALGPASCRRGRSRLCRAGRPSPSLEQP